MSSADWIVLLATLGIIIIYGARQSRKQHSLNQFLLGNQNTSWWKVGFTVMATQASAITFISTTGQGYSDGMRFVQFYFGLPLAMIVICASFIPRFYQLKVFTAYEYLEQRFDLKTRSFAAAIFLLQRGLAAGITLYAPSIILSSVFHWDLQWTHVFSGLAVIAYTVSGGAQAVTRTQLGQLLVILLGMVFIFFHMLEALPQGYGVSAAARIASWTGKMDAVQFELNAADRYNFWAGIGGGFFLALAYFGTDQSQVQRYLGARSVAESRWGLILNGILKIPMQAFILFCGVLLFAVFQFEKTPVHFNEKLLTALRQSHPAQYALWQQRNDSLHLALESIRNTSDQEGLRHQLTTLNQERTRLKSEVISFVKSSMPDQEANDRDYIFLHYITNYLPRGLVGLMIAVILCAAMSSISAELNALSGTTTVDIVRRSLPSLYAKLPELGWSRLMTAFWGVVAICFAFYAQLFENLIQFINIVGSLFYGTVLGIFLCAFYLKRTTGRSVFPAAVAAQLTTLMLFWLTDLGFLWYNAISCSMVMVLALSLEWLLPRKADRIEHS
ncbi:MAG: sodium:solute symporter [Saprospiraceae bacterium]|nr:sodium:solute symporter [Saprospiraceae bacterium]